jgi:aspartate-semialdehyde dehydrogenase
MTSVLLLGATGTIGTKIARELAKQASVLKRVAFLTPLADAGPEKEAKYAALGLERVIGNLEDSSSYADFDIVVSAVGDALCLRQPLYIEAAFEAGVKHFYPAECKDNPFNLCQKILTLQNRWFRPFQGRQSEGKLLPK